MAEARWRTGAGAAARRTPPLAFRSTGVGKTPPPERHVQKSSSRHATPPRLQRHPHATPTRQSKACSETNARVRSEENVVSSGEVRPPGPAAQPSRLGASALASPAGSPSPATLRPATCRARPPSAFDPPASDAAGAERGASSSSSSSSPSSLRYCDRSHASPPSSSESSSSYQSGLNVNCRARATRVDAGQRGWARERRAARRDAPGPFRSCPSSCPPLRPAA